MYNISHVYMHKKLQSDLHCGGSEIPNLGPEIKWFHHEVYMHQAIILNKSLGHAWSCQISPQPKKKVGDEVTGLLPVLQTKVWQRSPLSILFRLILAKWINYKLVYKFCICFYKATTTAQL